MMDPPASRRIQVEQASPPSEQSFVIDSDISPRRPDYGSSLGLAEVIEFQPAPI